MTPGGKGSRSVRPGIAYFVRRSHDACAVIKLYPDDREEVIASGLDLTDAQNLCVQKIDEAREAAPLLCGNPGPNRIIALRKSRDAPNSLADLRCPA